MQVVFLFMQQRDELFSHNSVVWLYHAIASENIERVSGESNRYWVLLVLDPEYFLKLFELLLEVSMDFFQGTFMVIAFDLLVDHACGTLVSFKFLLNFVLEEDVLSCAY